MKIGVSSYSFSRLVNSGVMEQIAVIGKAKEIGFDVIEFSTIAVPKGKTLAGFAAELRAEAQRVGIDIVNYTVSADLLKGSQGNLLAEIERIKGEVDVATILGTNIGDAAWVDLAGDVVSGGTTATKTDTTLGTNATRFYRVFVLP